MKTARAVAAVLFFAVTLIAEVCLGGPDRWTSSGPEGAHVMELVADPVDAQTMYVATYGGGMFRTRDGGETWTSLSMEFTGLFVNSIAIARSKHEVLYARTNDHNVIKSVDGGDTWVPFYNVNGALMVVVDPTNDARAYVGTPAGVVTTSNGGATWRDVSTGLPPGNEVHALAIDQQHPETLYAGTDQGLFMTTDRGATWKSSTVFRPILSIAVDPSDSKRIAVLTPESIQRTTDGGHLWKVFPSFQGYGSRVFADPARSSTVYVSGSSGISESDDDGVTWRSLPAFRDMEISALAVTPSGLYAGATRAGVLVSTDAGSAAVSKNSGLLADITYVARIDPSDSNAIYAGSASGIFGSRDGGDHWTLLNGEMTDTRALVIDPGSPSTMYAGNDKTAAKSVDSGLTWTKVRANPSPKTTYEGATSLAVDPSNPAVLYAALADWSGMSKSTDGGSTWSLINDGLYLGYYGFYAGALEIDPASPSTIFAASGGVVKSVDAGKTWVRETNGLVQPEGWVMGPYSLAIDPTNSSIIYAATFRGLYRTVNGGQAWTSVSATFPSQDVSDVAIDPADPSTVYAATRFNGIFRSRDRGFSWEPFSTGLKTALTQSISIDQTGRFLVAGTANGVFTYSIVSRIPTELNATQFARDRAQSLIGRVNASNGFVIVATGTVNGVGGARFRSDVSLVNHGDAPQDVVVAWLPASFDGGATSAFRLTLPPSGTTNISGLANGLGFNGLGSLVVIAIDATGNVDSRASIDGSAKLWTITPGNTGNYSQSVPAVPIDSLGNRTIATATGLRADSEFRTNAGIVNLDSESRTFVADITGERKSSTMTVVVEPLSLRQIAIPAGDYGAVEVRFRATSGEFRWTAYATSINNASGASSIVLAQ